MLYVFFFFNDTATTEIYTLSLHDALPISAGSLSADSGKTVLPTRVLGNTGARVSILALGAGSRFLSYTDRSEEHTSELQSLTNLVCRLLLEKKKTYTDYLST